MARRIVRLSLAASLACATATPALGATQPEGTAMGAEPVRVRTVDAAMQQYWSTQTAWNRFVDGEGQGWQARFDEATGTPHRMWGPGLDLGAVRTEAEVTRAVLAFVDRHAELLGLDGAVPAIRSANFVPALGLWYVDVDTLVADVPVRKSGLTFRVRDGRLVMAGAETYPGARLVGAHVLDEDTAVDAFLATIAHTAADHEITGARRLWLPQLTGAKSALRAVWEVRSRTTSPRGEWVGLVDASSGALVNWWNELRYVSGQLDIIHDTRLGDGETQTSPFAGGTISDGDTAVVTDGDGVWDLGEGADAGTLVASLDGPTITVRDAVASTETSFPQVATRLGAEDFDGAQAGLTTFHYVQQVQDYMRTIAPEVDWVDTDVRVTVNIEQSCNAWYDGSLNFLQGDRSCNNTGRLADVIFHEWGHGFHDYSLQAGFFDGSLGEGAADVMSFLMTDDSRIAPNFFAGGGGTLRNTNNTRVFPDDFVANQQYIHTNGLIFGGSMWDTREALRADHGEPYATDTLATLFAGALKGGPDLTTAYDEVVMVDDDDGDVTNGTPHQCAIVEGFGRHGLGPLGGQGIRPLHEVESFRTVEQDTLSWTVVESAPDCIDLSPTQGTLHWRVRGADTWERAPLSVEVDDARGQIPLAGLSLGTVVEYWVEIDTSDGAQLVDPSSGIVRPHTFHVGDALEVWCNDFETNDGGFRHELVAGEETEGADDWIRGEPAGLSGDPVGCFSGENCWANDIGGGNYDGAYQNGKHNRLTSRSLDTAHHEGAFLRYMRWLTVEDGVFDRAAILADGVEVWDNWSSSRERGTDHHVDDVWTPHVVGLAGAGDDGEVTVSWDLQTDEGLQFGGWNIDDVCIYAPATADNRLGITDFVSARGDDGTVTLSWTNPKHTPLQAVRVTRATGAYPTSVDDGESVWESADVALDVPVTVEDDNAPKRAYYAVYAYDGEDWLSWTVPGWNADTVDPRADEDGLPPEGAAAGCGCATTSGPSGALWLLGLGPLGLWGLRRRRA